MDWSDRGILVVAPSFDIAKVWINEFGCRHGVRRGVSVVTHNYTATRGAMFPHLIVLDADQLPWETWEALIPCDPVSIDYRSVDVDLRVKRPYDAKAPLLRGIQTVPRYSGAST